MNTQIHDKQHIITTTSIQQIAMTITTTILLLLIIMILLIIILIITIIKACSGVRSWSGRPLTKAAKRASPISPEPLDTSSYYIRSHYSARSIAPKARSEDGRVPAAVSLSPVYHVISYCIYYSMLYYSI